MESMGVPFECQKEMWGKTPAGLSQRYIVDFVLAPGVIVECASTRMKKYYVPLRKKAVELDVKSQHIKRHDSGLMVWVLFESRRPISEPFAHKLRILMPSVDQLFVSRLVLRAAIDKQLRCPSAGQYYHCVISPVECEYLKQTLAESHRYYPDGLSIRLSSLCAKLYPRWITNKNAKNRSLLLSEGGYSR